MRWDFLAILGSATRRDEKSTIKSPINTCPNCDYHQDIAFKFCPDCGQSSRVSKITFFSLIKEVLSNVFNLDATLYKSFYLLPIPGYLSEKYVQGERKQYLNPVRFFFFSMILFFTLIVGFADLDSFQEANNKQLVQIEKSFLLDSFNIEIAKPQYAQLDSTDVQSLRDKLFHGIRPSEKDRIKGLELDTSGFYLTDVLVLKRKDFFLKPIDEIDELNKEPSWMKRLLQTQLLRVSRDFKRAVNFMIGNGIWLFVAGIFLLSFVMKALYIRKGHFFIEHSILLFHIHAFAFTIGIICMLILKLKAEFDPVIMIGAGLSYLYIFLSMKRYYQQGWIKTLIKFILINFFYLVIMGLLLAVVLLLSIIFFN